MSAETIYPLSHLRVLDVGGSLAGSLTARFLARLGAEVIKVEPPGIGDPLRRVGPYGQSGPPSETGALHLFADEGKAGITLRLDCASGRKIFDRLVEASDVIVESLPESVLADLRMDYASLAAVNPRVVLTSVSPYGRKGPYSDFKGSEFTVFAMGGHMYRTGTAPRPPVRMGGNPAGTLAALAAAYATLVGVRVMERCGFGQHVDFSIVENQVTSHAQHMVEVSYYGLETGAKSPRAPQESRRLFAKDGPVMFSIMEQQLPALVELVGAPAELARPVPGERVGTNAVLHEYVSSWVKEHTQQEVYELGQAGHVPTSYTASPAHLFSSPQYEHRQFLRTVRHPAAGEISVPAMPFKGYGDEPPMRPAPLLGEHNAEVYGGLLGMTTAELACLFAAEVI